MALMALLTSFFIQGILPNSTEPDTVKCTFREAAEAQVLTVRVTPLSTRHPSGVKQVKMWLQDEAITGSVIPARKKDKVNVVMKGVSRGQMIYFIALAENGVAYMHAAPKADTASVTTRVGACHGHARAFSDWLAG